MEWMYQAYVVVRKGQPNEQRDLIYFGESKDRAIALIRDAIASGFEYGYIKQCFDVVSSYNEESFLRMAK